MKVKPYQFGLATISGFREHSNISGSRTNQNQLVNIYLMTIFWVFNQTNTIRSIQQIVEKSMTQVQLEISHD